MHSITHKRMHRPVQSSTCESLPLSKYQRTNTCLCSVEIGGSGGEFQCRYVPNNLDCILSGKFDVALSYAGFSMQGFAGPGSSKKRNQDSLIMIEDKATKSYIFACLDGHGQSGDKVSQFVKDKLELLFTGHCTFQTDPKSALIEVLLVIENELKSIDGSIAEHSGTTLALVLIRDNKLFTANIGDSRIILAKQKQHKPHSQHHTNHHHTSRKRSASMDACKSKKEDAVQTECDSPNLVLNSPSPILSPVIGTHQCRDLVAQQLTTDHKPDQKEEYDRILASGGRVFSVRYEDGVVGPARVWYKHSNTPGLAMSRSLGDFAVHSVGVVSTPEWTSSSLSVSTDCALVIASDGLWDMMSNSEVVTALSLHPEEPREAVMALLKETHSRWMQKEEMSDDTTICVVYLRSLSM